MVAGMAGMMGEQPPAPAYTIAGETIDGDTATVSYRSEGKEADESIKLVKEDGKWLVSVSKEDLNKEGSTGAMDAGEETEWSFEEEELQTEVTK